MGQISLPRLEKINTVMSWESSLLFNKERWLSIKAFIFLKVLLQFIFKNTTFKFKTKWLKPIKSNNVTQFFYKTYENFLGNNLSLKIFLNHYIYQHNNKYTLLVVYLK